MTQMTAFDYKIFRYEKMHEDFYTVGLLNFQCIMDT